MYLYKVKIEGLRKIQSTEIFLGKTTFLVGANNTSKSTVLFAISTLLNAEQKQKISSSEFFSYEKEGERIQICDEILITGEFRDVPNEYKTLRGFKGRIKAYPLDGKDETGNSVVFRKRFQPSKDVIVEVLSQRRSIKENLSKVGDYIKLGIDLASIQEALGTTVAESEKINATQKKKLESFDEIYDYSDQDEWAQNPGGFLSVFVSKLPRYVEIPALHSHDELLKKDGAMQGILNSLFEDVRSNSDNYKEASKYLQELSKELDPTDKEKDFGRLLHDLNEGFDGVFPGARLNISVDLNDPQKSIQPQFNIEASSNIKTHITGQGTGLSRSALFNLLKFRAEWLEKKNTEQDKHRRGLIIGFEEPEIYLHPAAQNLIRDFIYTLSDTKSTQIIATTHSPSMIDVSRSKLEQVINHHKLVTTKEDDKSYEVTTTRPFNIKQAFLEIQEDDREYVKMLMRIDDNFARAFFTEKNILFEGDTEKILFEETLKRLPIEKRRELLNRFSFISARGKATLIPLIKYCKAIGLDIVVMHDRDQGVAGAEVFNQPIKDTLNNDEKLFVIEECIEDVVEAPRVTSQKPYSLFKHINDNWSEEFDEIPSRWKDVFLNIVR